ncbi:RHS repeat-associated core domain-containing protein [Enterobacter soli]|uniref:RHS repeat-associated core domain-containing protein n=1 Tax=Enterobacter soli TaxID=885040 RepID=UPI003D3102F0
MPLAQTHHHALVQTPQVWWYGTDTTGAPVELTDTAGETVWRAQRLTWGNLTDEAWLAEGADNCLRLPGQYEDRETGLFYNLHRYYDPRHGRYITPDPVGLAGGLNGYAYADGDPVGWVDPLRLKGMPGSGAHSDDDRTQNPTIPHPEFDDYIQQDKLDLQIEKLRNGEETWVNSVADARNILDNMPELKPSGGGDFIPGTFDPPGTYRGDLINQKNPSDDTYVHTTGEVRHMYNAHFNITLRNNSDPLRGQRDKATILIKE